MFAIVDDLEMSFSLSLTELVENGFEIELGKDVKASEIPKEVKIESIILF